MTNNSTESNKNPDSAFNKDMTTPTDTPRTDAEIWDVVYHHKNEIVVDADFARELERELKELWSRFDKQMQAEAEVEFWKEKAREAEESESKHEAEVERLRQALSFITNDEATHDSTYYYRLVAFAALYPDPDKK